jgi:isopenicillin-N N-acyltransferase-like protein
VAVYGRLLEGADLRGAGAVVREAIGARFPDLVDEVEGIAAGAGVRADELLAINARTELLGPGVAGECSVAARVGAGGASLAQNWDWHPDLRASRVVWSVEPSGGPPFTTVTEAGILGKLGVNAPGVACGLNFLTSSGDGGVAAGALPIHVLLRCVLDRCGSVLEALALLMGARVTASSCVTLAGVEPAGPCVVAVELSPGGAGVVWPDERGLLVHTNHFAVAPAGVRDTQPAEHPSTLLRAWKLAALVRGGVEAEAALASHFPAPEGICRHEDATAAWPDRRATLLSVVLDPAAPALRLAAGPPCEAAFADVELPWAAP